MQRFSGPCGGHWKRTERDVFAKHAAPPPGDDALFALARLCLVDAAPGETLALFVAAVRDARSLSTGQLARRYSVAPVTVRRWIRGSFPVRKGCARQAVCEHARSILEAESMQLPTSRVGMRPRELGREIGGAVGELVVLIAGEVPRPKRGAWLGEDSPLGAPYLAASARVTGIPADDVLSRRRTRSLVTIRRAIACTMRARGFPLRTIAATLGYVDHTSVMHLIRSTVRPIELEAAKNAKGGAA